MPKYAVKYLLLFILLAACSQESSTKQVIKSINSGLISAQTYHDYIDQTVEPSIQITLKNYKTNPEEVCKTLAETSTKELLNLNETLEGLKTEVPCALESLRRIEEYYENFRKNSQVRSQIFRGFYGQSTGMQIQRNDFNNKLPSSAFILDKAYSLPTGNQLPSKVLNLTFDDGPHPKNTQKVLETLEHYGVKANFFVLGKNTRMYPELVQEEAAQGHSVGGHSMTHASLNKLSFEKATQEIMGVFDVIESVLGATDPFFRFPYGARTKALRTYIAQNNISDFFWNVDTLDWKYKDPEFLLKYALKQTTQAGRGIVLFHDIQPQTAAILPSYLEALAIAGYSTVVYEPQ